MRTCVYCGKPLTGQQEQYCSDACLWADKYRETREVNKKLGRKRTSHNVPVDRVCADCGAHFLAYPRAIRCEACRIEASKRANRESKARQAAGKSRALGSTDLCQRCGKPYIVNNGRQTMCPACAIERKNEMSLQKYHEKSMEEGYRDARNGRRREVTKLAKQERMRTCPTCGKLFVPTKAHRSYCSDACAAAKTLVKDNAPPEAPNGATWKPKSQFVRTQNGQRRLAAGLTKDKLGELAGLHPRTIYDWEHGRRLSLASREAIERALAPYEKHTPQ